MRSFLLLFFFTLICCSYPTPTTDAGSTPDMATCASPVYWTWMCVHKCPPSPWSPVARLCVTEKATGKFSYIFYTPQYAWPEPPLNGGEINYSICADIAYKFFNMTLMSPQPTDATHIAVVANAATCGTNNVLLTNDRRYWLPGAEIVP